MSGLPPITVDSGTRIVLVPIRGAHLTRKYVVLVVVPERVVTDQL